MTLTAKQLTREFHYNGIVLPDPGSSLDITQVRDTWAATYPELTSATVEGPKVDHAKAVARYDFIKAVRDKG